MLDVLSSYGLLPSRVKLYLNWEKYSYQVSFFHPKVLQQIVTSIFIIYIYNRFPDFRSNYLIINAYILSTVLMVSFLDFAILSFRSSTHFVCVEPIILTLLIKYFKYPQLMQTMIIIVFLLISYVNYIHNDSISEYILFVRR